jgi:site-specific DNA-methyltransferase (adenine-specific)
MSDLPQLDLGLARDVASHSALRGVVVHGDNLDVARQLPREAFDLIYVDPPFNTGQRRSLTSLRTRRDVDGDRVGFKGLRYRTEKLGTIDYADDFDDYLSFLGPRLEVFRDLLADTGSLYVHLDYREVHYVKVLLDRLFGRECFLNEIIWAYDYGARTNRRWPSKHDTILLYVKNRDRYYFDPDAVDRIPYMAPALVGHDKAARGKLPTDTWWHTIVPPAGRERTGYPTQKPIGIVRRAVLASSPPEGLIADLFAGSGTTGAAAYEAGRRFLMVDNNAEAIITMRKRFAAFGGIEYADGCDDDLIAQLAAS